MYGELARREDASETGSAEIESQPSPVGAMDHGGGAIPDVAPATQAPAGGLSPSQQAYGAIEGSEPGTVGAAGAAGSGNGGGGDFFTASRIGQTEDEGEDQPVGAPQHLEAGKADIAAQAQGLPEQASPDEVAAIKPDAGGGGGGGGGGGDAASVSPEIAASIGAAQNDTREAVAQAEAESTGFNAEMAARRDRFDAEQHATMLEQLTTMSAADKRSTLKEMGYDDKAVK